VPPHTPHPIVLFDGDCGLCHASVRFVLERDDRALFRFAPLDSAVARELLAGVDTGPLGDSVLLVENGRVVDRSTAALRIARRLRWWNLAWGLMLIPRFVRDLVYAWVARRRGRWSRDNGACTLPNRNVRERFLS
jgi:predicted DCC family thiol-disulfide oxidoreductase YuxK